MKNFASVLLLLLFLSSCSIDDGENFSYTYDLVAIDSVKMPDTLQYQKNYAFTFYYKKPSPCHNFFGIDFTRDPNQENTYYLAISNGVTLENGNCNQPKENNDEEIIAKTYNFSTERNDYYIFKFWQGHNQNGKDLYISKRIPVKTE